MQTVTLNFRDGSEAVYENAAINIVGDFLIVETAEDEGGLAQFYPSGSLRSASLLVSFEDEIEDESEGAVITPDFDGGASLN